MDLSVACDIRLGKLFATMPELQGKYIDIDPNAIETIVSSFEPESTHPLLFEAAYDGTIVGELNRARGNTKAIFAGGLTTLFESPDGQRESKVMIGVGGPVTTLAYNPLLFFARALEELPHLVDEQGVPKSGNHIIDDKLAISKIVRESATLVPPQELQETTVHELRHAADFTRPYLEKQSNRYNRMTKIKATLGMMAVCTTAEVASQIPFEVAQIESLAPRIAAIFAVATVAINMSEKYIERYKHKRELKSPHERLAYATAEIASSFPKVITFKDLQPSHDS